MTTKGPNPIGKIKTIQLRELLGEEIAVCRSARTSVKNPLYLRTEFGTFTPHGAEGQGFLERLVYDGQETVGMEEVQIKSPIAATDEPCDLTVENRRDLETKKRSGFLSMLWSEEK